MSGTGSTSRGSSARDAHALRLAKGHRSTGPRGRWCRRIGGDRAGVDHRTAQNLDRRCFDIDASARAKRLVVDHGIISPYEREGVDKVLNAAALTYVAAAIQAISTLLYYAFLLMGRRD